ncbi:MAG: hypothetical protein WCH84_10750, partial [Verrucomicrobiota bacterium]
MKQTVFRRGLVGMILMGLALAVNAAEVPVVKTDAAKPKPTAVLFLSWQPSLDKTYAEKLTARGFVATKVNYFEPLAPDFLKQFNVFVLDEVPDISYEDKYPDKIVNYHNTMR